MSNVTRLRHVLPMSPDVNAAVSAIDKTIAEAVEMAKKRDTCTGGQVRTLVVLPDVYSEAARAVRATR